MAKAVLDQSMQNYKAIQRIEEQILGTSSEDKQVKQGDENLVNAQAAET